MSELMNKLATAAKQHYGSELGQLLSWAVLHIAEQDEALTAAHAELEEESAERMRMELAIHQARTQLQAVCASLAYSQPTRIELAKDHAPHINAMAAQGVAPYARKTRAKNKAVAEMAVAA